MQRALATFNLELVPFRSQDQIAVHARNAPHRIQAYICNLGAHWFTIRRFAEHYFNLNSLQYVPMIMPIEILKEYLNMIENNGYSVFIVSGQLSSSLADVQLETNPISSMEYERLIKDLPKFIMDGKPMENLKDMPSGGDIFADIPEDIIEKYQQNPTDPRVREMITGYLPKGLVLKGIMRAGGCSDPTHHHCQRARRLLVAPASEHRTERKTPENLPPKQERRDLMLPRDFSNAMFEQPDFDQSDDLLDRSVVTTTISTQMLVRGGIGMSSDGPMRQVVVIQRTTNAVNPLLDSSETDLLRMMRADDRYGGGDNNDEKRFYLQLASEERRLRAEGKNDVEVDRYVEDAVFQRLTDKAIAASLSTPESFAKQSLKLSNTNSSPVITKETSSSEPEIIPISPTLTNTNPITPPPLPPQDSAGPAVANSPLPSSETNSSLPKTTEPPTPTEFKSNSPTVEGKLLFHPN